jgi:ribonuclease E
MATRMLIDARHPEETRVAVLKGNRIEEFDFESADHKQIKGNIYLAKVTRVEPSLQAAFVDFGGNRHGFLAFSEIHPDYYQIPKEDREALLAEEAAHAEEEAALRAADDEEEDEDDIGHEDDDHDHDALSEDFADDGVEEIDTSEKDDVATIEDGHVESHDDDGHDDAGDAHADSESDDAGDDRSSRGRGRRRGRRQGRGGSQSRAKEADELRAKRLALRRRYKIQDVIQRRQVLLVQVVKEERGNKGAALTTYLSLAGRYTVLMPNSSHGGGISRKISSTADRKRLKSIVSDLQLPRSMGLIVRTAGLQRTKTEIKRDFDYLARLWDEIRENTLASSAPAMIHSDSDLVKRAIRDIYGKEIEEVVVEGEEGYKSARSFMKLLMPSHAKRVKQYADPVPLFQRYGAEDQLSAMYDPMVQLKSGGYLVINPTEALVSIDINSGRSTKEHGIEQTALNTNLEAAREIARQLRLRDMAGLIVIDFIDMEYNSNVRKVEKAMKDALKHDRARIQVGRISGFGLMEMSRQRLRTGVLEATTRQCPHCDGTGLVRTASSAGLSALRLIEDEAAKGKGSIISLYASTEAAVYLLNAKRADLAAIERLYGVRVEVLPEGEQEGAKMRVQSSGPRPAEAPRFEPIVHEQEDEEEFEPEDEDEEEERYTESDDDERGPRRKRRRRRGGKGRKRREDGEEGEEGEREAGDEEDEENLPAEREHAESDRAHDDEDRPRKRRRRGGRRRRRRDDEGQAGEEAAEETLEDGAGTLDEVTEQLDDDIAVVAEPAPVEGDKPKKRASRRAKKPVVSEAEEASAEPETPTEAEAPAEVVEEAKPKRARRKKPAPSEAEAAKETAAPEEVAQEAPVEAAAKPKRARRKKPALSEVEGADAGAAAVAEPAPEPAAANDANGGDTAEPRRGGWWQRTFGE